MKHCNFFLFLLLLTIATQVQCAEKAPLDQDAKQREQLFLAEKQLYDMSIGSSALAKQINTQKSILTLAKTWVAIANEQASILQDMRTRAALFPQLLANSEETAEEKERITRECHNTIDQAQAALIPDVAINTVSEEYAKLQSLQLQLRTLEETCQEPFFNPSPE